MNYLPYFVARSVARDMDRRGIKPGLLIRVVVGIGSFAVLGMGLTVVAFVLDFIAWKLGLV